MHKETSGGRRRRIVLGAVAQTPAFHLLLKELTKRGYAPYVISPPNDVELAWPEVGRRVAEIVAKGKADSGIAMCWTGNGVAMAASTVPGIRAAYCASVSDASGARLWHDANVLALRVDQSPSSTRNILSAWLDDSPEEQSGHVSARERMRILNKA